MATTTASVVLGQGQTATSAAVPVQPCPTGTVADKMELERHQHFDITALVKEVSALRPTSNGRNVFDVCLIDGSKDQKTGKVKTMTTALYSAEEKGTQQHTFANNCKQNRIPVTFFLLQGSKEGDKFTFSSARKGSVMVETTSSSEKAKELAATATELMSDDDTQAFDQKEFLARDFSAEKGTETTCKLFTTLSHHESGIPDLDEEETLWQIGWGRLHEPTSGETIHSSDGKRLWFLVTFRDSTHHLRLYITEKAALQMTKHPDSDSFAAAHDAGKLWFPMICSIKILRKRKNLTSAGSAAQPPHTLEFDSHIVEAVAQDLTEVPTKQSIPLGDMLASRMDAVEVFLPAALHMVQKSVHYSMTVHYAPQELLVDFSSTGESNPTPTTTLIRQCSQVFALVEATTPSQLDTVGADGYKLTTSNVKDLLVDSVATYTLTAFCTLDNLQDFKLDPPRSMKSQAALIVISDIIPKASLTFIVDSVMLISRDEVKAAISSMKKLLYFTSAATQINTRKRQQQQWSDTYSPAKALKCRTLSRHPTGPELPDYKFD